MFNDDDFNHMVNSSSTIPDGIIDGTQYAKIFVDLNNALENVKPNSFESNIMWSMTCINLCYPETEHGEKAEFDPKRAADVITSLAYFCMTMNAVLEDAGVRDDYFEHQNTVVIPELLAECETIPWYDMNSRIEEMMKLDTDIAKFLNNEEQDDQ